VNLTGVSQIGFVKFCERFCWPSLYLLENHLVDRILDASQRGTVVRVQKDEQEYEHEPGKYLMLFTEEGLDDYEEEDINEAIARQIVQNDYRNQPEDDSD